MTGWFQSTRPRGTRRPGPSLLVVDFSFNPRVRAGRDVGFCAGFAEVQFQSTRPRGTRLDHEDTWKIDLKVSIHASARDATSSAASWCSTTTSFNPRVRAGRDIL